MHKQKWIWIVIGTASVAILAILVVIFMQQEKAETVKIGAILSMTGPASDIGEQVRDGMLLAVDEINEWGGVNGRKVELIVGDSKTNPAEAVSVFDRIEKTHHPLLYVSTLSSISTAVSPLAEQSEVVIVPLVSTAPGITMQKEWTFRYYPTAETEIPPVLSILKDLKVEKLGIHYLDDEFGRSCFELLKRDFEKTGGTTINVPFETHLEHEHKKHLARWENTEALYVVGFPEHFKVIFRALREAEYEGYVIASSDAAVPGVFEAPAANGVYLAAPIIYNPGFIFTKHVRGRYETLYSKSFDHMAANGYDIVKILAGLLDEGEISRISVKRLLQAGFSHSGIFGAIYVDPEEHDMAFPLHPARVEDGKLKYRR